MRVIYRCILIMIGFLILGSCDTSNNVEPRDEEYFVKFFGESGDQFGKKLIAVDGGFVIVGTSQKKDDDNQIYVVGTDVNGNELWNKSFGNPNTDDFGQGIVESANGLVLVGNTFDDQGFSDILVYNLTSQGDKIDSVIIGEPSINEEVNDVIITQTGNILLAGALGTDSYDFYFPRLSSDLSPSPSWGGIYEVGDIAKAVGLRESKDGNFFVFGTSNNKQQAGSGKLQTNIVMIPINTEGIPDGEEVSFGTENREVASGVASLSNGGFLTVGSTIDDDSDIYISSFQVNGKASGSYIVNTRVSISGKSIFEAQGGGYIVMGDVETPTGTNLYMTKTTNDGAPLWKRTFGFSGINSAGGVLQLDDGSIAFTGSINLDNQSKMILIKTNENGDLESL